VITLCYPFIFKSLINKSTIAYISVLALTLQAVVVSVLTTFSSIFWRFMVVYSLNHQVHFGDCKHKNIQLDLCVKAQPIRQHTWLFLLEFG
jgi:hypothetical protein